MPRISQAARSLLERIWPSHPRKWRHLPSRLRPPAVWIARLTAATVIAYLASIPFVQGPPDLTGALTALLVVQGTAVGTFRNMLVRVGAVFTGVTVAVLISQFVGLSWWSLGIAVALALAFSKLFRLTEQALETPISAMLILAVQGQEAAVENRILTTLIGAAIGFLFVVLVPARMPVRNAANRIRSSATATANLLTRVSESMYSEPIHQAAAQQWLAESRSLSGRVEEAAAAVTEAREARRLNPRAIGSTDVGPILTMGVATMERITLEVRNLFNTIALEAPEQPSPDDGYGDLVRPTFAWVLATLADCIAAYGRFIEVQALGSDDDATSANLDEMLAQLGEARASLADLMTVDPVREQGLWLLRGSILGALRQIVAELEAEERSEEASRLAAVRAKRRRSEILPEILALLGEPDVIAGAADGPGVEAAAGPTAEEREPEAPPAR